QFGGEANTCTTIRTAHVVKALRGLYPEPKKKYRLEMEYSGTTFICRVNRREVLRYRAMFPIPGSHLGLYSWNAGAHFRVLEIRSRPYEEYVRAMQSADRLFENALFELALDEYNAIAGHASSGSERCEARLKAGICSAHLGRLKDARRTFASLQNTPIAPFALAEAAKLELRDTPGANPVRAVNLFRKLVQDFPTSPAKAEIIPAIYTLMPPNFPSAVVRLQIRARLEAIGRETCDPLTMFQVQCQVDRAMHLMELGTWKSALRELLAFKEQMLPQHRRLVMFDPAMIMAALANGREDLVPASPFDLQCWDSSIALMNMGSVIHGPIRHGAIDRFLADVKRHSPLPGSEFFRRQAPLLAYLSKGDVNTASGELESSLFPLVENDGHDLHWLLWSVVDSRSRELFDRTLQWLNAKFEKPGAQKYRAEELIARAMWELYGGAIEEAARLLDGVHFDWRYSRGILFQLLLASLGLIKRPLQPELKQVAEQTLSGTELNLTGMFLGEVPPKPGALWPHRLWNPHHRLWLALWLEARGKRREARDVAAEALDPRYGLTFSQPALNSLLARL
ncbi:MAG TPA: hypothetical protein VEJ63_08470, partial [Planctomycetota bacterium]|nr:hypothetical protein [Planctomycetota bacterium]